MRVVGGEKLRFERSEIEMRCGLLLLFLGSHVARLLCFHVERVHFIVLAYIVAKTTCRIHGECWSIRKAK